MEQVEGCYGCRSLAGRVQEAESQLADAQATVEALQARVRELEEWKRIVTGAGTDQESVIRLAAHEYTKTAIQCWKEANAKLESQLTQRTAELEALRPLYDDMWKQFAESQAELERVRGERDKLALCGHDHSTQWWQVRYEELAALVAALPKVEGEIVAQASYVKDRKKVYACFGSDADMTAYAALLKHRQGMEG